MIIGIVGSEEAKFTPQTQDIAKDLIDDLIKRASCVVSGGCHLGGIDTWAICRAKALGVETQEFLPTNRSWSNGYKERNILIAEYSNVVFCITAKTYHDNYTGMRFPLCYHCKTDTHVKSGGCWTVKIAEKMGKKTQIYVISENEPHVSKFP